MSRYEVVGTEGHIALDPAFDYETKLKYEIAKGEKKTSKEVSQRDQFAPQLLHFSKCIISDTDPEPSGWEGLADILIIEAIEKSLKSGKPVEIQTIEKEVRPGGNQIEKKPAVKNPKLVNVEAPTK